LRAAIGGLGLQAPVDDLGNRCRPRRCADGQDADRHAAPPDPFPVALPSLVDGPAHEAMRFAIDVFVSAAPQARMICERSIIDCGIELELAMPCSCFNLSSLRNRGGTGRTRAAEHKGEHF